MGKLMPLLKENGIIITICAFGFLLRIYGLSVQSLWLDELGTMREADPSSTWGQLFDSLRCCDINPPLFFVIEKTAFSIFGYTDLVARSVTVLAGTVGIWSVYALGRQLYNKHLGELAAFLLSFNYFHIYYSQEARPYIFAFLFSVISFTCFLRLLKTPGRRTAIRYAISVLLLLYTHYYGLFVVLAQALLATVYIFRRGGSDPAIDIRLLRFNKTISAFFLLAGMIAVAGYLPWLSFLRSAISYRSGWIPSPDAGFIPAYVYGYFGDSELLNPVVLVLLICFIVQLLRSCSPVYQVQSAGADMEKLFVVVVIWFLCVMMIPYLWSVLRTPLLYPRYTIVALPAVILALAAGIMQFRYKLVKLVVLFVFALFSVFSLSFVNKYYTKENKTQFREITQYIINENSGNFPVVNANGWYQYYYFKQFNSDATLIEKYPDEYLRSILALPRNQYPEGFWLTGMHNSKTPEKKYMDQLDSSYVQVKEQQLYDAWARLFVLRSTAVHNFRILPHTVFKGKQVLIYPGDDKVALLSGVCRRIHYSLRKVSIVLRLK